MSAKLSEGSHWNGAGAMAAWMTFAQPGAGEYPGEYPGGGYPGHYPGYPTCPPVTGGTYPACGRPVQCPPGSSSPRPACVQPPCPARANCKTGQRPAAAGTAVQNAKVTLRSSKGLRVGSSGRVKLATVSCAMTAKHCRAVQARFRVLGKRKASARGKATLKIAPGQVKTLSVRLSAPALRALRRKGSLRTQVVVISGTAKPLRRTVLLRR
ncbi:MAG: hypothetical protein H0W96_08475 [Solirubrobacterales bacterium]|nr:hypothetical protein [Solirubrobacterales bacterium]